jgi:hypothetical protein
MKGQALDQQAFFKSHRPRCIADFVARPIELPNVKFDGHARPSLYDANSTSAVIEGPDYVNPVYSLSCTCGGINHFIHCFRWRNPDYHDQLVHLSPIDLRCAECDKKSLLFDSDVHGYDAELGHGSATVRGEGDRVVFECPTCGRQPLEALVRFELGGDIFDDSFKQFAGRQQDLFSWFSLVGKCSSCSRMFEVADFECA